MAMNVDLNDAEHVRIEKVRLFPDRRVSRRDAGMILGGRSSKTLAHWKQKGWGPKPITIGGREFYSFDECLAMARGEKPIKPEAA